MILVGKLSWWEWDESNVDMDSCERISLFFGLRSDFRMALRQW